MNQREFDSSTLTQVEQHLLIMSRRITQWVRSGPSRDELLSKCAKSSDHTPDELARAFTSLVSRAWLEMDEDESHVKLGGSAVTLAWQLDHEKSQAGFGEWLCSLEQSATYSEFCRRVHGTPFVQFNMVDVDQMAELMHRLQLTPENRVLDLGCAVGVQSEYLSDNTGAKFLGIDFSEAAIARARARTAAKRDRLNFRVADLDVFELPERDFTHALSFDTLYFVDNIENTLKRTFTSVQRGGQFAAFYSEIQREGESEEILNPSSTRLAQALTALGCSFDYVEFTEREHQHWKRYLEETLKLRPLFEAEGNAKHAESMVEEAQFVLKHCEEHRTRRYLYLTTTRS